MSKVVIQVMSDWNDCEQCGGGSEYVNGHKVLVKFLETGYETFTSTSHIKEAINS